MSTGCGHDFPLITVSVYWVEASLHVPQACRLHIEVFLALNSIEWRESSVIGDLISKDQAWAWPDSSIHWTDPWRYIYIFEKYKDYFHTSNSPWWKEVMDTRDQVASETRPWRNIVELLCGSMEFRSRSNVTDNLAVILQKLEMSIGMSYAESCPSRPELDNSVSEHIFNVTIRVTVAIQRHPSPEEIPRNDDGFRNHDQLIVLWRVVHSWYDSYLLPAIRPNVA
jgi:hypothetical protein